MHKTHNTNLCDDCGTEFEAGGAEGIVWYHTGDRYDLCDECATNNAVRPTALYEAAIDSDDADAMYTLVHNLYLKKMARIAPEIVSIIIENCGCKNKDTEDIVHSILESAAHSFFPFEYRFIGELGLGGKLIANTEVIGLRSGELVQCIRWFVTCYQEDMSPERALRIDKANALLDNPKLKLIPPIK
jgi:hypothetical protein